MDFAPSEEMQEYLRFVRKYVETELYPLEEDFRRMTWPEIEATLKTKREENKARGWWLPQIPEEYGGMGLSVLEHGLLCAEIGRTSYGMYVMNAQAPDAGNMEILMQFGTDEQKAQYLQPLLDGDIYSCFSMTEPDNAGSNPIHMNTRAVKDGDHWVINGRKWFSSAANGAGFTIVMAITDNSPDANPYTRASLIIVPGGTPGFNIDHDINVMGNVGQGFDSISEVNYDDVRVPISNTLGEVNGAFAIAQARLGPGRIHHCMRWIGICERCFDIMCKHVVLRETAPGVTLSTKQFVQGWVADSRAEINAARLMVLQAAWKIDTVGKENAREEIGIIKYYCANILMKVIDRALQSLGAGGMTDEFPIAEFYRTERAGRIFDGPDEVHKVSVARQILKRYAAELTNVG